MSEVNTDQAIFDAIIAATSHSLFLAAGTITIDTQKFIETFNNHRDRGLCTSLTAAQAEPDEAIFYAMVNAARAEHIRLKGFPPVTADIIAMLKAALTVSSTEETCRDR